MTRSFAVSPLATQNTNERVVLVAPHFKATGVEEESSWAEKASEINKKRLAQLVVRSNKLSLKKK